jgi:hypothetical protein
MRGEDKAKRCLFKMSPYGLDKGENLRRRDISGAKSNPQGKSETYNKVDKTNQNQSDKDPHPHTPY